MHGAINPVAAGVMHDPRRGGGWRHAAIRVGDVASPSGFVAARPGTGTRTPVDTVGCLARLIVDTADVARMAMYFAGRGATWPILDDVRRTVFPDDPPTATGVGVTRPDLDAALGIEMIAVAGSSG